MNSDILFEPLFDAALNTICNSDLTPWMVCSSRGLALSPDLQKHVSNGKIVFNISGMAVSSLSKKNECIYIGMTVNGYPSFLEIPYENVIAILAKEDPYIQLKFSHPPKQVDTSKVIDVPHRRQEDLPDNVMLFPSVNNRNSN